MVINKAQKIRFVEDKAELVETSLPELAKNQVLIKTHCSMISPGTERAALTRSWDDAGFRESPGYALAGEVVATGPETTGFKAGDRVITLMNHASYIVAPADPWVTLKIPDNVSYETATFLPLASVAMHAIRRARIEFGESIAIIGAGIIGQIAVQLAKMSGARQVMLLDLADNRLELGRRNGADVTVNPGKVNAVEEVLKHTGGKGASLVMEATGNTKVIPQAFKMAAFGGRVVCVGVMEEAVPIAFHKDFIQRELSLVAAFQPFCPTTENIYWRWTQQTNRQLLLELISQGKIHVDELITHRFQAKDAPQAYAKILVGDASMLGGMLEWA